MQSLYEKLKEHAATYEPGTLTLEVFEKVMTDLYKERPPSTYLGPIEGFNKDKNTNIAYPFEFHELLLTDKVLDVLGFSEYWGDCGESGTRTLDLGGKVGDERLLAKKEYPVYHIHEIDNTEDPASGYAPGKPEYCPCHYVTKDWHTMYFLHEMWEDIVNRRTSEEVQKFLEITMKPGVNMYPFIESYIKYKEKQNG